MPHTKELQRKYLLELRNSLSGTLIKSEMELTRHLVNYIKKIKENIHIVGVYMPIKGEVSPLKLLEIFPSLTYAIPVIDCNQMKFVEWNPLMALQPGGYNIPEPVIKKTVIPDVIVTPLLGFDEEKNRLGYGKGFYDRYFADINARNIPQIRIGIAYSFQQVVHIQIDKHDIKLDMVITEKGII